MISKLTIEVYIHQYEFSKYYKPLSLYHFVKLKFAKYDLILENRPCMHIPGF